MGYFTTSEIAEVWNITRRRVSVITVLFSIMLTLCSCSGYLETADNAGVAENGTGTEDNAGVAKNGTGTEDNAGGDGREDILDGITPGEIGAVDSAKELIKNGDLSAAEFKLEQDAGYEGAYYLMLVKYLRDFEYGDAVRMSDISAFLKKEAAGDDFIIETLNAEPALQEYVKLYGEYTCGDITLIISDDGSVLRRGINEDGTEYEERKSIYYGKHEYIDGGYHEKYWLDNFYKDSEPAPKEYIERSGEDLIITVDGNEYIYEKKSN
ncbi:MAG: hypothetical protein K5770_04715 [Lachnospiraceae bacterium]|nr:hypothetical protein [Lachnospiraceae bacterium]